MNIHSSRYILACALLSACCHANAQFDEIDSSSGRIRTEFRLAEFPELKDGIKAVFSSGKKLGAPLLGDFWEISDISSTFTPLSPNIYLWKRREKAIISTTPKGELRDLTWTGKIDGETAKIWDRKGDGFFFAYKRGRIVSEKYPKRKHVYISYFGGVPVLLRSESSEQTIEISYCDTTEGKRISSLRSPSQVVAFSYATFTLYDEITGEVSEKKLLSDMKFSDGRRIEISYRAVSCLKNGTEKLNEAIFKFTTPEKFSFEKSYRWAATPEAMVTHIDGKDYYVSAIRSKSKKFSEEFDKLTIRETCKKTGLDREWSRDNSAMIETFRDIKSGLSHTTHFLRLAGSDVFLKRKIILKKGDKILSSRHFVYDENGEKIREIELESQTFVHTDDGSK